MAGERKRYLALLRWIRRERGETCEACGTPARYAHHIIGVAETSIHSPLFYEPANLMLLCDDCHSLMHPLIRNIANWQGARIGRGQGLQRT